MNAVLDYDALEILGAALREQHSRELDEPLTEDLMALYLRLEAEEQSPAASQPAARLDQKH